MFKRSPDSSIPTDSKLIVIFDHFKTENNDAVFTTVESFYNADFDDIPTYEFDGEMLYLSDLIDWRIDAANILSGNGELDTSYRVNWNDFKNCILLTKGPELKRINTKLYKIIEL